MSELSFPTWPFFSDDEIAAVGQILRTGRVNYWTGSECRRFEDEFATWCTQAHAVSLANGTVALELALRALNIGAGDEVVVTPRSFVASASCIVAVGAKPVFAEVDADSQNITPQSIAAVLTPKIRAIITVHLAGWPCDMPGIRALADAHRLKIIEDCAQAHGARIGGRAVGSFGDIAAWSFCQDKIITTGGEGGMLTTNDLQLWERAWSIKDHGKSYEAVHASPAGPGFRWVHDSIGTNGRMMEVQAAIGRIQLRRLQHWHERRAENARAWQSRLARWSCLRVPMPPADVEHGWYKFYAFVEPEHLRSGWTRNRLLAEIIATGVPCFSGSCPEIYRERAFAELRCATLPVAYRLGETSLMFLLHPTLSPAHIHAMADHVDEVLRHATA